jgi:hypothetical protein
VTNIQETKDITSIDLGLNISKPNEEKLVDGYKTDTSKAEPSDLLDLSDLDKEVFALDIRDFSSNIPRLNPNAKVFQPHATLNPQAREFCPSTMTSTERIALT